MIEFLRAIPAAATSPLALTAYLIAAIVFAVSGAKLSALRRVSDKIEAIPPGDRRPLIQATLNAVVPDSITPEEWIKATRARQQFLLLLATLMAVTTVLVIALTVRQTKVVPIEPIIATIDSVAAETQDSIGSVSEVARDTRKMVNALVDALPKGTRQDGSHSIGTYEVEVQQLERSGGSLRSAASELQQAARQLRSELETLNATMDDDVFIEQENAILKRQDGYRSALSKMNSAWDDVNRDLGRVVAAYRADLQAIPSFSSSDECRQQVATAEGEMEEARAALRDIQKHWKRGMNCSEESREAAQTGTTMEDARAKWLHLAEVYSHCLITMDEAAHKIAGPGWLSLLLKAYREYGRVPVICARTSG